METLQHQTDQRNAEREINEWINKQAVTESRRNRSFFQFIFFHFIEKDPKKGLNLEDEEAKSHKSWRITSKL